MLVCASLRNFAHEIAGAARTRHSLYPLYVEGDKRRNSGALRREVGAEAQGMDRLPDHVLDRLEAAEIDDRNNLAGDVGKPVAGAGENFWRPLDLAGIRGCEEALDRGPTLGGFEIALGQNLAVVPDGQRVVRILEMRMQGRQPFVPHQHEEMSFWQPGGGGRIEAAGPILDRITAVSGEHLANAKADLG